MTGLSPKDIDLLKRFNSTATEIIESSYVIETNQKWSGIALQWKRNPETNDLDFTYRKENHDEDKIRSLILSVRLFVQDKDKISLKRMGDLSKIAYWTRV
jgi:hypothetical protein